MIALALAQLLTVLAVTYACGWLLQRLRQPAVVGEIAGGLLLGPLVLGQIAPRLQGALFPAERLGVLEMLSRIGLVLFLFLIGSELDLTAIRRSGRAVAAMTAGSMLLPFVLGLAVAPLLWHRFAGQGGLLVFALFTGTAMSITALPVLASLLRARRESIARETASLALMSASVNDLLGWCVLAAILTLLHRAGGWSSVFARMGWLLLFVAAMLFAMRPLLRILARAVPLWLTGVVLAGLAFLSAQVTDALGLHAFFGAFLAGLCVPRDTDARAAHAMRRWLNPAIKLTLPVFFALTGLRMLPGLFRSGGMLYLLLIVAVAVAGKIAGAAAMARWSGIPSRESLRIGVLLNTRGLVELIVLKRRLP